MMSSVALIFFARFMISIQKKNVLILDEILPLSKLLVQLGNYYKTNTKIKLIHDRIIPRKFQKMTKF